MHYDQKDWAQFSLFAEFCLNSRVSQATGLAPFEATKGYLPRDGMEPPTDIAREPAIRKEQQSADALLDRIQKLKQFLVWNLTWARAKMEEYANRSRLPTPRMKEGDWVMLDARNVRTVRRSKGLDQKNLGPFRICRDIDNGKAFELDLKDCLPGIFPVFHPWLLHPVENEPLPGQRQTPQPPISVDDDGPIYEVDDVLDSKVDRRRIDKAAGRRKGLLMYLVKWRGWESPSWQPYWDLTGCKEAVKEFHDRNPEAEGPHKSFYDLVE